MFRQFLQQLKNLQLNDLDQYNLVDPLNQYRDPAVGWQFDIGSLEPGEDVEIVFTLYYGNYTSRVLPDLSPSNLSFVKQGNDVNVSFDVWNNDNISVRNFKINLYEIENNVIINNLTMYYNDSISPYSKTSLSTVFNIAKNNDLYLFVDPDYNLLESNEGNNYLTQKYYSSNVYLDVNVTPAVAVDVIEDYILENLKHYNRVDNPAIADYILRIGYNPYNDLTLLEDWGKEKGSVMMYDEHDNLNYNALINIYNNSIILDANAIEGVVAGLRQFNFDELENNVDVYIGKDSIDALSTYDFFNYNSEYYMVDNSTFANVVEMALLGGYSFSQELVKTQDLVTLRLKHISPQHTYTFKNLLDYIHGELDLNYTELPVVMAGGLWNNLTYWEDLAGELAATGRDVWMVEITGGPYTDCINCSDYDFNDLIDSYWPAIIAGVQAYTGKDKVQYVGFSNGARTALSSLDKWNAGKADAGLYWNGTTWKNASLSAQPIDHLVAVAAPGAFEGDSAMKSAVIKKGQKIINHFEIRNISHADFNRFVGAGLYFGDYFENSDNKISLGLFKNYFNFMNSSLDVQPGPNVTVNKFTAIRGYVATDLGSDLVVTKDDMDAIYGNVNAANKNYFKVFGPHAEEKLYSVATKDITKDTILRQLNGEFTRANTRCWNQIDPVDKPGWCI